MPSDNKKAIANTFRLVEAFCTKGEMTATEIAEMLGCTARNAYYTVNLLKNAGFIINHSHGTYKLDASSEFFKNILSTVVFTREQAVYLYKKLINGDDKNSPLAGMIIRKLYRFYDIDGIGGSQVKNKDYMNMSILQRAIKWKRMVILHNYSSSNSNTVSDRKVEPFTLLGENSDVRAYELKSGKNKTFKISRIGEVEILDDCWAHADKHKLVFTDMFMYSGEEKLHVKLRFDLMAHNFMLEEYPHSEPLMTHDDATHWIYEADLASYISIGRFILGLYDDVEVLEDDGLREYLKGKINKMAIELNEINK